jgi:hypothetical protein
VVVDEAVVVEVTELVVGVADLADAQAANNREPASSTGTT